jgi:hypothetical protein
MRAFPILAVLGLISYPALDAGDFARERHAAPARDRGYRHKA